MNLIIRWEIQKNDFQGCCIENLLAHISLHFVCFPFTVGTDEIGP
jgi:hypothetical protein